MYDEEEEMYREYYKQLNAVEEEREDIERKLRKNRENQTQLEYVFQEMNYFYREVVKHCDGENFIQNRDLQEDIFFEHRRKVEQQLEDESDDLEARRNATYEKEDIIREGYNKRKIELDGLQRQMQ